jgi:hypothetical protein
VRNSVAANVNQYFQPEQPFCMFALLFATHWQVGSSPHRAAKTVSRLPDGVYRSQARRRVQEAYERQYDSATTANPCRGEEFPLDEGHV